MKQLQDWWLELRSQVRALGTSARIVGIGEHPTTSITPPLGVQGFPSVVPLWSDRRGRTAGLLAKPHCMFDEWPGVLIERGQGLTVASNARTFLPQVIVVDILSNAPDSAETLAESWGKIQDGVKAFHGFLGGEVESLEAVIAVATNADQRHALYYESEDKIFAFEKAHGILFRQVDKSPTFERYAEWIDAAIDRRWQEVEAPSKYGPWARRLLCSAQRFELCWGIDLGMRRELRDWLILGGAGVDSALPEVPSWAVRVGAGSGEATLVDVAERRYQGEIDNGQQEPDAIADGLTAAILKEGTSYTGLAHAEAAVAFNESGRPEQAWEALQSAAWWSARNTGATPEVIRRGMLMLAAERGWADIEWVVRNSMPEGQT